MSTLLLSLLAVPVYLLTGLLFALQLTGRISREVFTRQRLIAAVAIGLVLHALLLWQHMVTPEGLNFGFFNVVSLLTWVMATLFLLTALNHPVENLGIAILPLAALGIILNQAFPTRHLLTPGREMLDIHILISITAYSILALATVQAILLAIQDRHLHAKHPGGFIRKLPPLQTMERMLFQMIGAGFLLQSLSLVTGFMFIEDVFAQHMVHKTFFAVLAWLVFGTLLWGRWKFGWRGRIAIRWTLGGFLSLLLAYLGSKLVLELLLGY
jgi:ABC-type uncharacterized transport system permease subunit